MYPVGVGRCAEAWQKELDHACCACTLAQVCCLFPHLWTVLVSEQLSILRAAHVVSSGGIDPNLDLDLGPDHNHNQDQGQGSSNMIDTDIMVKLDGPCIMMTLTMLGTTADITAHIEQIDWQHLMLTDPQHLIGMMTADTAGMTVTRMLVTTATETAATAQLSANTGKQIIGPASCAAI